VLLARLGREETTTPAWHAPPRRRADTGLSPAPTPGFSGAWNCPASGSTFPVGHEIPHAHPV